MLALPQQDIDRGTHLRLFGRWLIDLLVTIFIIRFDGFPLARSKVATVLLQKTLLAYHGMTRKQQHTLAFFALRLSIGPAFELGALRFRLAADSGEDKGVEPGTSGDRCADCVLDVNEFSCEEGRLWLDDSVKIFDSFMSGNRWLL